MRVDVRLGDSELALLAGYNRSTSMGIKKPGELQRELLSDMENIEEKRMLMVPEVKSGFPEVVSEAHEVPEESGSNVAGGIRADLLSKLSELASAEDNSDETDGDALSEDGEGGVPSESEENVGILPDDEEDTWEEGDSTLPDDEEDTWEEGDSTLSDDEEDTWEEGDSTLSDDEENWEEDAGTLPDDEEDWGEKSVVTSLADEDFVEEEETETPSDDDGTLGEGVGSEEDTTGISSDEEYSDELLEDSEYSDELPEDEDEEYSEELPEDEDSEELPEDEESEELPEDDEDEVEAFKGVSASAQEVNESASSRVAISDVVEKPAPSLHRSREPMPKHTTSHPTGCSAPPVSLYDFILNNGGSMLIEDVRKCYPVDEVKKALNLGKIYRFGNKVGV